jgi:iron complex transport system substrate-binding protein
MRRLAIWLFVAVAAAVPASANAQDGYGPAQRVVSVGVCADQLLLTLADPSQIASLSQNATNAAISYLSAMADQYPHGVGGIEALIGYAPDLVLADATTPAATLAMVERLDARLVVLPPVATVDEAIDQVHEVAALLGREEEGNNLADLIEAARRQATRTNWGDTVVSFRRGGNVPGNDTLMSDLLAVIGLNNVGDTLSKGDGRVPLEVLVASPPDYLVVPEEGSEPIAGPLAMLDHPALAALFPPEQRMLIPDRLTYCGGPSLPEALRRLASELARVTP